MARRFVCGFLVVLCGCATFGTAGAGAATEIGSGCDPDSTGGSAKLVLQLGRVSPPTAVKTTGPGVVTSWRVQSAPFLEPATMTLKVLRQTGGDFEVLAESTPGLVLGQPDNRFPTRIPVSAGVLFGVSSSKSIPTCFGIGAPGDTLASFNPDVPVGGKAKPFESPDGILLSLAVVVEPDADGDGFGDETQDKCPQSATTQGTCPTPPAGGGGTATVKLKGKPKLEGNVVAVKLTTSATANLTVTGSIRGKSAAAPATKTVSPGETGRIYLQLKKSTKQRLANQPRKRKLRMVVEVKAAGSPTVSAEISLPGRKKPQPARASR